MAYPIYYPVEDDTLPHLFDTFDGGDGSSITMTGLAVTDIEIYKDGGTTQRASDAGYTLLDTDGIDFDGITGIHGFSIDLSDNTDAGFYTVGPWYHVVISSITIDAQTVSFVACAFRIASATRGLAGTALPAAAADAAGGLPISDAGGLDLDTQIGTDIDAILVDTNSLNDTKVPQTLNLTASGNIGIDWANVENPSTAVDLAGTDIQLADTTTTNTDMRGTDNAALASVVGALADAAAAGDPTTNDTLMQYLKQLVNVLVGTTGVTTFPAEAAPGNNVSLAEVIRAVHVDVTGLNGDAMRGTDSAALAATALTDATWTDARAGYLDELAAANIPADLDAVLLDTGTTIPGTITTAQADLDTITGTDGVTLATAQALYAPATAAALATHDGKLDTVDTNVDAILVDTGTTIPATITTAQNDLDILTGTDGATLATAQANYAPATAAALVTHDGKLDTVDTNVDSILTDTGTTIPGTITTLQADTDDIQTRLPAALVTGRMSSDAVAISGSTAAADNLEASAETIVIGAAEAGTLSITVMTSDLTEATDDHYIGRHIVWTSGALLYQATDITDYAGSAGTLTFTAVTEAPSAGDTFVIV